jgi:predicted helicase
MPRIDSELQRLQEIKTLPSLIKYLKDDLNWPIGSDDVESVVFDYDPAELGFDTASTAKIEEVCQLRPLTAGQKWGVFWVKFGKKQLPVQMLRRALGNLVVKKRASTKKADRAAWNMHDLLFISAYGDDSNRHITFAHFSESEDSEKSLPVLKVLSWDEDDTLLHLKDTYKTLVTCLNWETTPTDDPEAWREHWSKAFRLTHKEVINTTKELVVELAHLATVIKKSVLTSINAETEKGPWKKLMLAFQKTLIKDLNEEQFADVIAQTISYGLLTARLSSDGPISLKNLVDMVPSTNPFLKELLQHFLTSAGMKGLFDVDEAGINDVVELLNRANAKAIRNDFGKKTDGEDPVIHFYEHFLGAYNKKLKVERGVFYTPQPIVSYIVRSVHELLQKEFGLEDGLADTSTWSEVKERHKDLKIPEGIKPDIEPFVQILDPATGTATFLIEIIDVIHNTMTVKWDKERVSKAEQVKKWNTYVPTHLLPRLYAYELMMAPYAIAHMKVGLKLAETGFTAWEKIGVENRANIFLTNSLELWSQQPELPGLDALANEAAAVNEIKRYKRFTVIIGNPPYSHWSSNLDPRHRELVEPYKFVHGERIRERGALQFELNIQDDYVKFIRLGELTMETSGVGVVGLITNNAYLDSATFRGLRAHLLDSYDTIYILDLHGSVKAISTVGDENVFDIQQGVAINISVRSGTISPGEIHHDELTGSRESKYASLNGPIKTNHKAVITPRPPGFLFIRRDESLASTYESWLAIDQTFPLSSSGVKTNRDGLTIAQTQQELDARMEVFLDQNKSSAVIGEELDVEDKKYWNIDEARKSITRQAWGSSCRPIEYRPFDTRKIVYHDALVFSPRKPVMVHLGRQDNIALLLCRQQIVTGFSHAFVTRGIFDCCLVSNRSRENTSGFPLFTTTTSHPGELLPSDGNNLCPNISPNAMSAFSAVNAEINASGIFNYIYAILHSPLYRRSYAKFLQRDFPRVPIPGSNELHKKLAGLGGELIALHLIESVKSDKHFPEYIGKPTTVVEHISWGSNTVWLNKTQTAGFKGIPEEIWQFNIGSYQVCEKWLKDRKGRKLTKDDIEHYQKIVVALSETIRLMAEIDKVIDEHGGWPGAFQSAK